MGQIIGPGSFGNYEHSPRGRQPLFSFTLVRQYGLRGLVALLIAALLAFAPLALLVWFNVARLTSVVVLQCASVVVKPGRYEQDREADKPGKTALLQITCEAPAVDGWRELLCDEDPARRSVDLSDNYFVRRERVYLRKVSKLNLPFGLLGKPPVSVWLPAGDYELAVVHEAPRSEQRVDARSSGFPLVTVFDTCSLSAQAKVVRRIRLPHYDWGNCAPIAAKGPSEANRPLTAAELQPLVDTIVQLTPIPTPGGYVLALAEPRVTHSDDHRNCAADFSTLEIVRREWNRDQIATLRNWLPASSVTARDKLSGLIDALGWREMCEGWFCYAAVGVAGLVFTRWGALAILEPQQRRKRFGESVKLYVAIFLISVAGWILFQMFFNSTGCHGPVQFRA